MAQVNLNNNKTDDERKQSQENVSSPSASSPNEQQPSSNNKDINKNMVDVEEEEEVIDDPDTLDVDEDLTLQYRWALWYSAPKSKDKEKKWDTERVKKVVEVGNVKEFWRYYY